MSYPPGHDTRLMVWTLLVPIGLLVLCVVLLCVLLARKSPADPQIAIDSSADRLERAVREEFVRNREESAATGRDLRTEIAGGLQNLADNILARMGEMSQLQHAQLESFSRAIEGLNQANTGKLEAIRGTVERQLATFSGTNELKLESVREVVERKLGELRQDNNLKLEAMRATVDEKLHATLEHRLGESFKLVSDRLEQVHTGLGEMRGLAAGVGDLKKVLTNIKTRGCWGEVQLGTLLDQMLTPDQFAANVAIGPDTNERVEFAVKLPGREVDAHPVWLPIDAKFPQEEYQRLVDAQDRADVEAAELASAALETSIKLEARKIRDKYIKPPYSTDFALMFLPTEGLFAEVLRRPGLCDGIQREFRVVLSGPTTLSAVLSSLQMGFRTLAIERRSSEVWNVLGAVKTEFGKFGQALEKVQKKLHEASSSIDDATRRSRAVERKLRSAQELPAGDLGDVEEQLMAEN